MSRELWLPMPVWDGATRLCHWLLVAAVAASYGSGWSGLATLHRASGLCVLALLLFRVIWGFVGSDTARFARFLAPPRAVLRQLADFPVRAPDLAVGHSAMFGWMAVIILALLAIEVGTGLLPGAAGHAQTSWILLAVIALQLLVILAYAVVKGQDLVRPMITGRKRLPAATPAPRMASPLLALVVMLVAGAVTAIVSVLW